MLILVLKRQVSHSALTPILKFITSCDKKFKNKGINSEIIFCKLHPWYFIHIRIRTKEQRRNLISSVYSGCSQTLILLCPRREYLIWVVAKPSYFNLLFRLFSPLFIGKLNEHICSRRVGGAHFFLRFKFLDIPLWCTYRVGICAKLEAVGVHCVGMEGVEYFRVSLVNGSGK